MARTRHKILVAVPAVTERLRPEPQLARGQDDGAAVGGHPSFAASTTPQAGLGLPNTHTSCFCGRRRSVRLALLPLRPGGKPFGAPCCRRAVGSAKMGCRLRPRQCWRETVQALRSREDSSGRLVLDGASRRTLPRCSACLLVSYRPLAHYSAYRVPKAKTRQRRTLIAAGTAPSILKRAAQ